MGRARHQAGALSAELRQLGASVIGIPFIEIRKPRSFQRLDEALRNLAAYDWLILTSANGVEAMWERMGKLGITKRATRHLHVAAIGPATRKAIEQRGLAVDVMPNEYVAESVVRSLKSKVKGKCVLLVRAKVARDVIPRELGKAGAHVDVIEAYETVVPQTSRRRLRSAMKNPGKRPHVLTFTSSSTVRNFVELLGESRHPKGKSRGREPLRLALRAGPRQMNFDGILMASIGPVTSSTLREFGLPVNIEAKQFTIPGLVDAIARVMADRERHSIH